MDIFNKDKDFRINKNKFLALVFWKSKFYKIKNPMLVNFFIIKFIFQLIN